MLECTFQLNRTDLSRFQIDGHSFPAFSGNGRSTNNPKRQCLPNEGPIPVGRYYIVERTSGILQSINAWLSSPNRDWFALFAVDDEIDDFLYCDGVKRGQFRLHPLGEQGLSLGCVTILMESDFYTIRSILLKQDPVEVGAQGTKAYGILNVV